MLKDFRTESVPEEEKKLTYVGHLAFLILKWYSKDSFSYSDSYLLKVLAFFYAFFIKNTVLLLLVPLIPSLLSLEFLCLISFGRTMSYPVLIEQSEEY